MNSKKTRISSGLRSKYTPPPGLWIGRGFLSREILAEGVCKNKDSSSLGASLVPEAKNGWMTLLFTDSKRSVAKSDNLSSLKP